MVAIMNDSSHQLEEMLVPIINSEGCDLIEIKSKGGRKRPLIQVFIDRDGGVDIDDCAKISRKIADLLDVSLPDVTQYRLEVSSPGVHRPLKTERDFRRNIGHTVRIQYTLNEKEASDEGKIVGVDYNHVRLQKKDCMIELPLNNIREARIQLKW